MSNSPSNLAVWQYMENRVAEGVIGISNLKTGAQKFEFKNSIEDTGRPWSKCSDCLERALFILFFPL